MKYNSLLLSALGVALSATTQAQVDSQTKEAKPFANYELAKQFKDFNMGGKYSRISLSITPYAIEKTDNFWYDFDTSKGRDYYLVQPAKRKHEHLFDNAIMAEQLSLHTHQTVDGSNLHVTPEKFAKICLHLNLTIVTSATSTIVILRLYRK